ncbi:RodZ domain-containing protein, partial [Aquabacterium sp. A08]|uniref:RodZ domain-containing protein n=1 Tax=Aquabacterium sp. A08 TaxID=2718532 RepID=UPI0014233B95
ATAPNLLPQTALRQARERAGLALPALAAMLKVPVQRLEALEEGRYHDLPDTTFARALASSVCRVLKIDPAPVLAALPASAAVRLGHPESALNAPMPTRQTPLLGGGSAKVGPSRLPWANALAVLVVVVAVTLWFLLPPQADTPVAEPAAVPATAVEPVADPALPVLSPASAVAVAPEPSVQESNPLPAPVAVPDATPTPLLPTAIPPAAPTAAEAAGGAVPGLGTPAPPSGVLQLRARGASWVQVTGASGRVLLQRGLQAGEQVAFSSDLPLTVVVGRADETEVQVRG